MNARTPQILLHVAGCTVVLALPLLFSPETLTLRAYLTNPPTQRDLIFNALLIALFYINYYGLIPKFYFRRQYLIFLLINIAGFFAINFISSFPGRAGHPGNSPGFATRPAIQAPFPHDPADFSRPSPDGPPPFHQGPGSVSASQPGARPRHSFFMDISQHLFIFLVVMFLALLLKIRERLKHTEKEKLQAELSYLRAQINPHFLFNILNSIYALTIERSPQAPDAVIRLSGMMRYVLDESGKEAVSLDKELDYIRNYIALQESRFGGTIRLEYQIDPAPGLATNQLLSPQPGPATSPDTALTARQSPDTALTTRQSPLRIAPLILIPFIENAFKHGVNPEEDSEIRIRITINNVQAPSSVSNPEASPVRPAGTYLQLDVFNKKVHVRPSPADHGGLGIANTQRRLALLYPNDHTISMEDNKDDFRVFVTLRLAP